MSDCLHEPNAADLPRMPGSLGEQVRQARSAPGQTLASCHATARRILDDMKRGAIHKRIRASLHWAASAGLRCEFPRTALSARWLAAGHNFSLAFLVQAFSCVLARGIVPSFSASMAGASSRALRLPYGRLQSSSTISHRGRVIRRTPSTMPAAVAGAVAPR